MTTAVIVQARVGSTRLPGKVLKPLGPHTVLEEVLRRCRKIPGIDVVVCAIPDGAEDAALIAPAERAGARVVRGPGDDVLARYAKAAAAVGADVVMRVTSDCPLIDPEICGEVLALRIRHEANFAANDLEPTFPHGLDCEVFTMSVLREALNSAVDPYDREHVTPWMRRADHLVRVNLRSHYPQYAGLRWTLDYPEDLAFIQAVHAALADEEAGGMASVIDALARTPALQDLNACRRIDR